MAQAEKLQQGEHGSCIINTDSLQPPGCYDVSYQREAFSLVFWQNESL